MTPQTTQRRVRGTGGDNDFVDVNQETLESSRRQCISSNVPFIVAVVVVASPLPIPLLKAPDDPE